MIRHLEPEDADSYARLRRESLVRSPLAFASSPEDDVAASVDSALRLLEGAPESVIIGAFAPDLIGAVGLYRDRHLKAAHKAHLWGMYVAPSQRGRGTARLLLNAALEHASTSLEVAWVHLSVSSAAPEARRLYESVGFQTWGTEPDALRHGEESVVEYHMVVQLGHEPPVSFGS